MQHRIEITGTQAGIFIKIIVDAQRFRVPGFRLQILISVIAPFVMHPAPVHGAYIVVIKIISRRSLEYTPPGSIDLCFAVRLIIQRGLWCPMGPEHSMVIHPHSGNEFQLIPQLHGILQINGLVRDFLIAVISCSRAGGGFALMPFQTGNEHIIPVKLPAILVIHPIQAGLIVATEIAEFIIVKIAQEARCCEPFLESIGQRIAVEELILVTRRPEPGFCIIISPAIDGLMFHVETHGTARIQLIVQPQGKAVIIIITAWHVIVFPMGLVAEIASFLKACGEEPAQSTITALIRNFISMGSP